MAQDESALHPQYPIFSRLYNGFTISAVQGVSAPVRWIRGWNEWFWPSGSAPNIVKTYECRPYLPIRIFFPKDYDQTSPETLPLVFSIHGGGFCVGDPEDDDRWNRRFSDEHRFLVVELNYRKAPWYPFPTATYDLEALILAVVADESLPFDKNRVAVTGFSAGGNLALSVCQLPAIREKVKPTAALPIYPSVDQSILLGERAKRRHYKPDLKGILGQSKDMLAPYTPIFKWSYINPGQDLRDPLLSPYFAPRDSLPPHIYIVAAELDQLGHEAWRMACKLSGRPEPKAEDKVGQAQPAVQKGALILDNERYAFQHKSPSGQHVGWLLVPDQVHGFDHLPERWFGDAGSFQDSQIKTAQYQKLLSEWLHGVVWNGSQSGSQ
ncbi:hypothetical protein JX266_010066 [Neoarthrinium moseri]|nr:hypothetical protein JX266_010066 [Neoarthrinium moseri]